MDGEPVPNKLSKNAKRRARAKAMEEKKQKEWELEHPDKPNPYNFAKMRKKGERKLCKAEKRMKAAQAKHMIVQSLVEKKDHAAKTKDFETVRKLNDEIATENQERMELLDRKASLQEEGYEQLRFAYQLEHPEESEAQIEARIEMKKREQRNW